MMNICQCLRQVNTTWMFLITWVKMGHVLLGFASPDAWKNEKTSSCTSFHIFPKVWIWKFFSKFVRKSWFFSIAKAQRANLTWFQPHSDQKCSGSVDSCGVRPRQTNTKKTHRDVVKKEWIISVFFEKKTWLEFHSLPMSYFLKWYVDSRRCL